MKHNQLPCDPVDPLIGIDPPAESPQPPEYDNSHNVYPPCRKCGKPHAMGTIDDTSGKITPMDICYSCMWFGTNFLLTEDVVLKDEIIDMDSNDNPWIDCEDELPPCDGHYQILDDTNKFWAVAFYDGFGFLFQDVYRIPKFWKKYLFPKKSYGKIKKLPPGV